MTDIPIVYPVRGLNENWSFSSTPAEHSQSEENMRVRDCRTGRLRGAQRPGYEKYLSSQIHASDKLKRLASVVVDNANITFANKSTSLTGSDVDASTEVPSEETCFLGTTDRLGNIYALDGKAGFVKYNSELTEVYRWSLPTVDESHVVRAFEVDDLLCVFAGVSEGGDQQTARLWRFVPDFDSTLALAWTIEPGGYIVDLEERNGVLYVLLNFPDQARTELRGYGSLASPQPSLMFSSPCQYPATDLAVSVKGDLYTAHPYVLSLFAQEPKPAADADPTFVSWTPLNMTDARRRIWSWHAADNIDGQGNATVPGEDAQVLVWRDLSGNERHYYADIGNAVDQTNGGTEVTTEPPTYTARAQAGKPGVRFNGVNQLMKSLPNVSDEFNLRDSQKTTVPAYRVARDYAGSDIANTGSAYVMFLVVRVDVDQDNDIARFLWSHEGVDDGSGDRHVLVNKTAAALGSAVGASDKGRIFLHEVTDNPTDTTGSSTGNSGVASSGNSDFPASANANGDAGYSETGAANYGDALDNTSGIAVITYCCDGGFQTANYTTGGATETHSFLRINGRPIDRYASLPNYGLNEVYLGGTGIADGSLPSGATHNRFFKGHVLESIVIDRGSIDLSSPTLEDVVVSHEKFGNASSGTGDANWAAQGDNEVTRIESYLLWKWGKNSVLPGYFRQGGSVTDYDHPYTDEGQVGGAGPALIPNAAATVAEVARDAFDTGTSKIIKWTGDSGQPVWCENQGVTSVMGVVTDSAGDVYGVGEGLTATEVCLRKLTDSGGSFAVAWTNSLGFAGATGIGQILADDFYPKMAVDSLDNVYVPVFLTAFSPATGPGADLYVFDSSGSTLNTWMLDGTYQTLAYAVALPPVADLPAYPSSLTNQRSDFLYAFTKTTDENSDDTDVVHKVSLVTKTVNAGAPRTRTNLVVSGANIVTFDSSSSATPTGGSSALSSTARFVDVAVAFEKVFLTDGASYKFYDAVEDEVFDWESTTAGEIPPRCRLIAQWNGRIVLARGDDPFNWFMSAKGDPFDWDFAPAVPLVTQALRGTDSRLGIAPDVVTAIIPYDDNVLFIGCDSSIHRIVGEPFLTDQFDLVTDKVGIAWNTSWTKDREGRIYFFESQGGVWVMSGDGSDRRRLTRDTIEQRLRSLDLSSVYVQLEWSFEFEGLHIFVFPYGSGGTALERYFWEQQTDAWHVDTVTATSIQPLCALTIDGDDPGDRVLVVGSEGGYILEESADARDDDGQAINAFVRIGPIVGPHAARETRFRRLEVVLADDQDGARYALKGSNEPDVIGQPRVEADLMPGRNPASNQAVCAAHVWLELRNGNADERFAFESAMIRGYPARRKQPRGRESTLGT